MDIFSDDPYAYGGNTDVDLDLQPGPSDWKRVGYYDDDLATGFEGLDNVVARAMATSASEKAIQEIRRQLYLPIYNDYENSLTRRGISLDDIQVGLQNIERIEFYNPDTLVAAAIFKTTGQPVDKTGIRNFKRPDVVNDYNLFRYYRFLETVKFKYRRR